MVANWLRMAPGSWRNNKRGPISCADGVADPAGDNSGAIGTLAGAARTEDIMCDEYCSVCGEPVEGFPVGDMCDDCAAKIEARWLPIEEAMRLIEEDAQGQ